MNNVVIATLAIALGLGAWTSARDSDDQVASTTTADSNDRVASTTTADSYQQVAKPIQITKINYDPWIAIRNIGQQTRGLRGWTLRDTSGDVFSFPQFQLRPGMTVVVHAGHGQRTPHDLYWGLENSTWSNTGGRITLRNSDGRLIDRCRWSGGHGLKVC